jgi:hypothetical protein
VFGFATTKLDNFSPNAFLLNSNAGGNLGNLGSSSSSGGGSGNSMLKGNSPFFIAGRTNTPPMDQQSILKQTGGSPAGTTLIY